MSGVNEFSHPRPDDTQGGWEDDGGKPSSWGGDEKDGSRTVPKDFKQLLPKVAKDKRPFEYLWSFDPDEGKVHVTPQHTDHPADFLTFETFAKHITHPERVNGFAVAIQDGWRIFTTDFVEPDPFILKKIRDALEGKHPAPPLPAIRYHGDPHD